MSTQAPQDLDALRKRVNELRWHHQIDLGNGIVTPGLDRSDEKLAKLELPSLQGKSVLDIGAWNGYFSFAAERLGARRVMAVDSFAWGGAPWGSQESFNLAREVLGSKVEDRYLEVNDVTPETVDGTWDVVLFLGVLYHLEDPMMALRRMASVTGDVLVLETLGDLWNVRKPAMAFYEGDSMVGDDTNFWAPNAKGLAAMLREVGFRDIRFIGNRGPGFRARQTARNLREIVDSKVRKRSAIDWNFLTTERLIVHARR